MMMLYSALGTVFPYGMCRLVHKSFRHNLRRLSAASPLECLKLIYVSCDLNIDSMKFMSLCILFV